MPDTATLESRAKTLLDLGPRSVLLKGGHADGEDSVDVLVSADRKVTRLSAPRLAGSVRGTGCALASAIAAGLAVELPLLEACREGKRYISTLFEKVLSRDQAYWRRFV